MVPATRPSNRTLVTVFAVAVAVSIVHYVDNTVNYADYPRSGTLPNPPDWVVGGSWFLFTAFGVAGVALAQRGRDAAAALCLAFYSGSGLVGLLHYAVPGATGMAWWRQMHIVLDIACGVAVFVLALRLALSTRTARRPGARTAA